MILLVLLLLLVPFLLNAWHGYFKPAQNSDVQRVDCSYVQDTLRPHVDDIIRVMETHGNKLSNPSASEGYKIVRDELKKYLPDVYARIEKYVSTLEYEGMRPMDCDEEKYCWFLRLYNKDGHFLDWHFDNNFTSGLRYTFVCNVFVSPCNTSHFLTRDNRNRMRVVQSEPGSGVIYNGTDVKHAISSQTNDCVRIALIVPLYENANVTLLGAWRKWARGIMYRHLKL
jgi:hypothetical protein